MAMRQSRARLVVTLVVVAVAAAAFISAGVMNYRRLERLLDARLGEALVSLANAVAASVEMPPEGDAVASALTLDYLARVRQAGSVETIVLLDATGQVLLADPPYLGERTYLSVDNEPLARALTGEAAYGQRYRVDGIDLKSAFAPVVGPLGDIVGVVGVEAPANFFGALSDARWTQAIAMATGLALIVALTAVMAHFWRRTETSERALNESQRLAMVGQMTATMAHEVRNPLSVIRATAERLRRKYGDGSELFDFIPEEVDRLDRLTRWYLNFARPVRGELEPLDLAVLVDECVGRLRKEFEAARIAVETSAAEGTMPILADRDRVTQALLNVLMNAQQAMESGGRLTVSVERGAESFAAVVSDTGPGIPQKDLARVFEPFHTTKANGSGLGLAVVRQVMDEHGGHVLIHSSPGDGTTVRLVFQRA